MSEPQCAGIPALLQYPVDGKVPMKGSIVEVVVKVSQWETSGIEEGGKQLTGTKPILSRRKAK